MTKKKEQEYTIVTESIDIDNKMEEMICSPNHFLVRFTKEELKEKEEEFKKSKKTESGIHIPETVSQDTINRFADKLPDTPTDIVYEANSSIVSKGDEVIIKASEHSRPYVFVRGKYIYFMHHEREIAIVIK